MCSGTRHKRFHMPPPSCHHRQWALLLLTLSLLLFASQLTTVCLAANAPNSQNVSIPREVRGLIISDTRTIISSEIAATITDITVNMGERFVKDQPLVSFAKAAYQAKLKRARIELRGAREHLAAKKRLRELKSVSELDVIESRVKLAKIEAERELLQIKYAQCTVLAPFNGRVIQKLVSRYQYVQQGTPLLEIIDDSKLSMQMLIPSSWIGDITMDQPLVIHVDELDANYHARVASVGATIDSNSQTLELRAVIPGHHPELLAGMSGSVTFSMAKE